ncbi:MAG: hypothetical protein ABS81_20450 [Pseudonocardia sp. SCN 72-86]|nr:MAG: hypothetical protein ABS81_20450 [Pseudonocardia sp. SCN 72-86]
MAEHFGRIDVCVDVAGISPPRGAVAQGRAAPLDLFRKTVDIDVVGAFDVLRHAVAAMSRNDPGPDGERGLVALAASFMENELLNGEVVRLERATRL